MTWEPGQQARLLIGSLSSHSGGHMVDLSGICTAIGYAIGYAICFPWFDTGINLFYTQLIPQTTFQIRSLR